MLSRDFIMMWVDVPPAFQLGESKGGSPEPEGNNQLMKSTVRNLFSACIVLGAAGVLTTGAWAADAAAGKTLYASKCRSCHGADGTPPPAMMKTFSTIKPLNDASIQGKSDAALKDSILKGFGKMSKQAVSDTDADNLVAAVRAMK